MGVNMERNALNLNLTGPLFLCIANDCDPGFEDITLALDKSNHLVMNYEHISLDDI
jgi:hypothetical protein